MTNSLRSVICSVLSVKILALKNIALLLKNIALLLEKIKVPKIKNEVK